MREEICKALIGKRETVDLLLTAVISGGHILIEDLPGLGKTTLAKALAKVLRGTFSRVQFTPDLMPADIIGTSVYSQSSGEFSWRPGPVFSNVLLADEINRATPRTQSALLEAMNEFQISSDGQTRKLADPFIVIATQNPIEHAGTYPLPESQLDRFMLRLNIGYPDLEYERDILTEFSRNDPVDSINEVLDLDELRHVKGRVKDVRVEDAVRDYILSIVTETRGHSRLIAGVSPRGSLLLYRASQAYALLQGREFVIPDDVKTLAVTVLAHRVIERAALEGRGTQVPGEATISRILDKVPVPV